MELDLRDKSALITSGSKGIGLATATAFAAEGVALHLAARTESDLETARDEIKADFDVPVSIYPVDLSKGEVARQLARDCAVVDILVNNAGAIPGGTLEDIDEEIWRRAWDLKLFGYINMMRAIYAEIEGGDFPRCNNTPESVQGQDSPQRDAPSTSGFGGNADEIGRRVCFQTRTHRRGRRAARRRTSQDWQLQKVGD